MQQSFLPENQIFTVSQINSLIKEILESTFSQICIEGEISNYKPSTSGHVYFTLKDSNSQIRAVIFRSSLFRLNFKPKDGDKVRCTGSLSLYAQQGNYQIIVSKMELAGSGNILQMLEERKQKLYKEGLFAEERKKSLPLFPKTIGIVTSPTGAAIRDILQITKRRNKAINIVVLPSLVQGSEAAYTICKMIELANFYSLCDVLIVGRGGGSLEDLLPFSEETVVRAVAASKIPVISAVGHEIDWALCDYAADKRAATPSAAAELAVPLMSDLTMNIQESKIKLYENLQSRLEKTRLLINSFNPESLELRFRNIQQPLLNRFDKTKTELTENMLEKIKDYKLRIQNCITILENASPESIFKRGYSMVRVLETGEIFRNPNQVKQNTELEITASEGSIKTKVI